jgi:signal peptidase II
LKLKSLAPYALLALAAVLVDQWIKHLVETGLPLRQAVDLLPFLALYRTYNTGIAFSMFAFFGAAGLIVISLVVAAFILYLAVRTRPEQVVARAGFALIVGGAVGNLVDRAVHGHVIDYILFHTPVWSFAVFNLADAFITVGAGLVILDEFLGLGQKPRPSHD